MPRTDNKLKDIPSRVRLVYLRHPEMLGNPLSLGYLKTYSDSVLGKRVQSDILELEAQACHARPAAAAARILAGAPDIVGFSCYLWNVEAVIETVRALKKKSPGVRVLLGGPDASGRGAAILAESDADALVTGEGELTFVDLLERSLSGRSWAGTPGTIVSSAGRVTAGPPRPNIKDLDIIPSPYLAGLFDASRYGTLIYETSRGCPFKCEFCSWTSRGGLRYFSEKRALEEAAWIAAHARPASNRGSRSFRMQDVVLADQDIALNGPRGRRILAGIREYSRGKSLLWIVFTGLGRWAKELAREGNSPNFEFNLGVESINPAALKGCGRVPLSAGELEKSLQAAVKLAPEAKIIFQLMLGMPGDGLKGFMESLTRVLDACVKIQSRPVLTFLKGNMPEALIKLGFDRPPRASIEIFHLAVLPGSVFYAEGGKRGMTWDKRPPYAALSMPGFSPGDFDQCYAALRLAESLTRGVFGQSMVSFTDIRSAAGGDPHLTVCPKWIPAPK